MNGLEYFSENIGKTEVGAPIKKPHSENYENLFFNIHN